MFLPLLGGLVRTVSTNLVFYVRPHLCSLPPSSLRFDATSRGEDFAKHAPGDLIDIRRTGKLTLIQSRNPRHCHRATYGSIRFSKK